MNRPEKRTTEYTDNTERKREGLKEIRRLHSSINRQFSPTNHCDVTYSVIHHLYAFLCISVLSVCSVVLIPAALTM